MKKHISKIEKVKTNKVIDCLCNKCGKSIFLNDSFIRGGECVIRFNYGSVHDDEKHEFDLCDECFDEFVKSLKHKPEMQYVDFFHCMHCTKIEKEL